MTQTARIDLYFAQRALEIANMAQVLPTGKFIFELTDTEHRWIADFCANPPTIRPHSGEEAANRMRLSTADLASTIDDPLHGYVLGWQRRIDLSGDWHDWTRATQVIFPAAAPEKNAHAGLYASLARLLPDPRIMFMNLGLSDGDAGDGFWQHCIALLKDTAQCVDFAEKDVVDIGSGRGGSASYIAAQVPTARVTGVDYSADNVEFCRARYAQPNLSFLKASADDVPLPEGSADVVINLESSHCYPSREAFFAEVDRLMRPGGVFCFTDIFTPQSLADTRTALADMTHWRCLRAEDVSDRVAQSLHDNRAKMRDFFISMIDPKIGNQTIVYSLIENGSEDMERKYRDRTLIYHSWQFQK